MKNFESLHVPKYVQLMIRLREQIEQGVLKEGDPMPTRERLMKEYSLSLSTVTRAITELERQGWLISRQGSGTFVVKRSSTQREDHNKNMVIGVLLPWSHPYYAELTTELAQEAQNQNVNIWISCVPDDEEIELNSARLLFEKQINALIWSPVKPKRHIGVASLFAKNRTPVVICDRIYENNGASWICIASDHFSGAQSALDYLYELGHRRIAYIGPKGNECNFGPISERWDAYKEWMKSHELWNPEDLVFHANLFQESHAHTDQIKAVFKSSNSPTAILGYDDIIALETVRTLTSFGIRVPSEVAVIGHGDNLAGQYSQPRLSTVSPCTAEYVDTLFRILLQELSGNQKEAASPKEIVIPQRLILRDSVLPVGEMAAIR